MFVRVLVLMLVVMMIVAMPMRVVMVIFQMHVELHAFDRRLLGASKMQMISLHPQLLQLMLERMKIHAQIQHRANKHVAADAAENIEVKRFHFAWECSEARELIWLAA